ncbi:hypothetical protein JH146_1316 [Methanocaldococcus bathoardescens]|uniref:DUF5320 domain-containing protein n=1 Tax=Methanocaldococcus bathoardescens TaxID=1301915 RepID=A0A076LI41_9EURY|nr:hypothetical protein [Methanocaldococcus bathoardescens]AIJ06158.1 hypothetical protein JH146_1316 [Methanocaldococcus bathoardescens]
MLGWGRGLGRRFWRHFKFPVGVGGRYRYVGPCRCGLGPHAFYVDEKTGALVHAWDIYRGYAPGFVGTDERTYLEETIKELEEEKKMLEEELARIKKRLDELKKD